MNQTNEIKKHTPQPLKPPNFLSKKKTKLKLKLEKKFKTELSVSLQILVTALQNQKNKESEIRKIKNIFETRSHSRFS